jgi:hypothetical protein
MISLSAGDLQFDITKRRETNFVLWIPGDQPSAADTPRLILGKWDIMKQRDFDQLVDAPLQRAEGVSGLWELSVASVAQKLPAAGQQHSGVYIYWFRIRDTREQGGFGPMLITDPLAYALDYRDVKHLGKQPAAVIWMDLGEQPPQAM